MQEPNPIGGEDPRTGPAFADVKAAAARIGGQVYRTPIHTSRALDGVLGVRLVAKCENLQRAGAFKFRGASNAVLSLDGEAAAAGVATHSSGNHAGALALAARLRGVPAHVVMPEGAPAVKVAAVEGYGARIRRCAPTLAARESTLAALVEETGATFIHPYDDPRVIAGQGTAALELLAQVPDLEAIVVPVGGGGLLSGTILAAAGVDPGVRVYGAEPAGADDACRSLAAGRILPSVDPVTVADGLLTSLGRHTFPIIQDGVEAILTVSEEGIRRALRLVWERMKLVVEPSGVVPVAALLEHAEAFAGRRVGVVFSGGNADLGRVAGLLEEG